MTLDIEARLNDTQLVVAEKTWQDRLRAINHSVLATEREIRRVEFRSYHLFATISSIGTVIAGLLPAALRPAAYAFVNLIQSTVATITAVVTAYTAGGPATWVQAAFAATGLIVASYGLAYAIDAQQRLDAEATRFQSTMEGMSRTLQNLMFALGGR